MGTRLGSDWEANPSNVDSFLDLTDDFMWDEPFFSTVTSNITLFAYPGLSPGPRIGFYGVRLSPAPPLCLPVFFLFLSKPCPRFHIYPSHLHLSSMLPSAMSYSPDTRSTL
jgi:hypothetical protein